MKTQNRRTFVKASTTMAVGSTLLSGFSINALGASKPNELRVGLVGCGGRGTGAAFEALKTAPNVKLTAMADAFEDRVESSYMRLSNEFGSQVSISKKDKYVGFDGYKKVIEKCDVVILATPPPFRPIHFEAAVKADKHVFMEKPLFVDIPGYHKIISTNELAKQKNLNVAVGLQLRFEPGYQELMAQIKEGVIGDVRSLNAYYNVGAPKIHPREEGQTEMQYQMRNWRYFTWLWGGQLSGQTIHQIDIINWLMNDYPTTVNGLGGRIAFSGPNQGNTYDHHYAEFEYDSGIKLHVQSKNIDSTWNRNGFEIVGTKGSANDHSRIYDASGKVIWQYRNRDQRAGSSQLCQSEFINSVLEGKPLNQTEYGAGSSLTCVMGRMAIHSGKRITMEEALASERSILPKEWSWDTDMPDKPGPDGNYPIPIPGKTEVL